MNRQIIIYAGIVILGYGIFRIGMQLSIESAISGLSTNECCDDAQMGSIYVSMSKSPCFGDCPSYEVTISNSGKMKIIGHSNVRFKNIEKQLTTDTVQKIGKLFYSSNFFQISNSYGYNGVGCKRTATDNPSTSWHVKILNQENSVALYKGCDGAPRILYLIEAKFEEILEIEK